MEVWYRGGSFQKGGVDIYQVYHFYIYSRNNFSVKIVSYIRTYIFFSSSAILKKKVILSSKSSQSDGITKWKKPSGLR